jgi:hypothetical protein
MDTLLGPARLCLDISLSHPPLLTIGVNLEIVLKDSWEQVRH